MSISKMGFFWVTGSGFVDWDYPTQFHDGYFRSVTGSSRVLELKLLDSSLRDFSLLSDFLANE